MKFQFMNEINGTSWQPLDWDAHQSCHSLSSVNICAELLIGSQYIFKNFLYFQFFFHYFVSHYISMRPKKGKWNIEKESCGNHNRGEERDRRKEWKLHLWLGSCFAVWHDEIAHLYHTGKTKLVKGVDVAKGVIAIKKTSPTLEEMEKFLMIWINEKQLNREAEITTKVSPWPRLIQPSPTGW